MLHPRYHALITRDPSQDGKWIYSQKDLPEGMKYRILHYSQFKEFVLVCYELGKTEKMVGETLFHKNNPVASGGGRLPLYEPPEVVAGRSRTQRYWQSKVRDRLDKRSGWAGVPDDVALKLRDPLAVKSILDDEAD